MNIELPFQTSNAALAFALYLAGVPFADNKQPLVNIYNGDTLRAMGYKGISHEVAANLAISDGKKGHVEYGFQHVPELEECKNAFNRLRSVSAYPEPDIAGHIRILRENVSTGHLTLAEAIAGVAGVIFDQWPEQLTQWKSTDGYQQEMKWQAANEADAREHVTQRFLAGSEMGLVAAIMVARKSLTQLWKNYPPIISIRREGRVTTARNADGNGKTKRGPGSALYTPNAGNDIRRYLRVPTR